MKQSIPYNRFVSARGEVLQEAEYNRLLPQALAEIETATFHRSTLEQPPWIAERIEQAAFALILLQDKQDQGGELAGETVGAWSRSYVPSGKSVQAQRQDAVWQHLAITGLLYQGGG